MGQDLPLPQRIPCPDDKTLLCMNKCGITIHDEYDAKYLEYSLPDNWRMVNDSRREDLPRFHIIDGKNMVHFTIIGSWKGNYDNELDILMVEEPYEYKPRDVEIIPSETDSVHMIGKIIDHYGRQN